MTPDQERMFANFGEVTHRAESAEGWYEVRNARVDATFMVAARDAFAASLAGFLHEIARLSARYVGEEAATGRLAEARLTTYTTTLMQVHRMLPQFELLRWSMDLWEAAIEGGDAHAGFVPSTEDVETPYQWWFTEMPAAFETAEEMAAVGVDVPCQCEGVLVLPSRLGERTGEALAALRRPEADALHELWRQDMITGRQGVVFLLLLQPTPPPDFRPGSIIPLLPRVRMLQPVSVGQALAAEQLQTDLFAALQFLRQEYVTTETVRLPRSERRRRERRGAPSPPVIQQIVLRRRRSAAGGAGDTKREYHNQWIVSGHWRNQYYPSEGRHRPKFISEYVKGPEGRPLKARRERVYLVKR